jgi:DnaJ-class molecular chaperone
MTTLYDTLGVPMHATADEIKRAYRKAAMKWHPDRNVGNEAVAHVTFHDIKDAYAILSDVAQRKVYDSVYAEQMRGWEAQRARAEQAAAKREADARAADQAAYAQMVSLAMRFAEQGHNRDVVFGVLLGRACDASRAAQIADSVAALQASRQQEDEAVKTEPVANDDAAPAAQAAADSADPAKHAAKPNGGDRTDTPGSFWHQFLNGMFS